MQKVAFDTRKPKCVLGKFKTDIAERGILIFPFASEQKYIGLRVL